MSLEADSVIGAVAVGVGATLGMDLWNHFLKRAFGIPSLNYCLLGRWVCHMARGTFRHVSISAAPPMRCECVAGWVAHYSIGLVFALAFVLMVPGWLAQPSVLPALLYGVGTVVFPFFVMQPSLGLGIAGSRTLSPTQARLKSVATHTVFGVGMYLSAVVVDKVQHVLP
jgi:hypothetical protein